MTHNHTFLRPAFGLHTHEWSSPPWKIIKALQLLPLGQFLHWQGHDFSQKNGLLFEWTKGISSLLSLSLWILSYGASLLPTRLFLSYQQHWLPIPLNCLLCKLTADERAMRGSCPRLFLQISLSVTFPGGRISSKNCSSPLREINSIAGLE